MASSARRHQPHSTPGQPDHSCSSTLVRTLNQPPLEGNPADGCGSGKNVYQTLAPTSSGWGLGREVWAASLVLRVRIRLECPEDNLRELM